MPEWHAEGHFVPFNAFQCACFPMVLSRHCARTRSISAHRIIATLGTCMQSGSLILRTAHIRSNMALITPPRSQQTSTGHMIISAFVSHASYGMFNNNIFIVTSKTHTSSLASCTNAISPKVHHSFHFEPLYLFLT
jgi:hypothetical protein